MERIVRGLDERIEGGLDLPRPTRDQATSDWLPADMVPIVGALPGDDGALGALRFVASDERIGAAGAIDALSESVGSDPDAAAHAGVSLVCTMMAELLPNAPRPRPEFLVGRRGAGDSVALAAGVGTLLRFFGVPWPADLVVTGGIDTKTGRFTPVPRDTLPGKVSALRAWGFKRLGVVAHDDDADLPDAIDGVELVRFPADPNELPAFLATLAGVALDDADVARALALFDLRVGRAGPHMLEHVFEVSAPFLEHGSPLVRHLVLDMRSRALLHAGRSEESRVTLEAADALRGEGYLPDGRLRDVLRYQQSAHRSVVQLDVGIWSDEDPVHQRVDRLIEELDDRWNTRHESLMRIFLANTRARRHEYLGRLHGDETRLQMAWDDLSRDHDRWEDLIVRYAGNVLRLRDTTRERIENQLVDVAASRVAVIGTLPGAWRSVLLAIPDRSAACVGVSSEASVLEFRDDAGSSTFVGGSGFNALAGLRRHLALEEDGVPAHLEPLLACTSCELTNEAEKLRYPWFVWFEQLALLAQRLGRVLPMPAPRPGTVAPAGWEHLDQPEQGIESILALRSRWVLRELGVALPELQDPPSGTSLRVLHDLLLERPDALHVRTPY